MNYSNSTTNQTKIKEKRTFNQLNYVDRINIEKLIKDSQRTDYNGPKITCRYLASKIGCSYVTISRELKRGLFKELINGKYVLKYIAQYAISNRKLTSKRSHYRTKLLKGCEELKYISRCLKNSEDVYSAIQNWNHSHSTPFPVCEKTLYNYFHKRMIKGIKPYRHYKIKENIQKMAQKGPNISERPFNANDRSEFGHWEGDLIVGSRGASKQCLLTLIERQTRVYLAVKIDSKHMTSVINGLNKIEQLLGKDDFKEIFKTITFDNGREFNDFHGMESSIDGVSLRTKVYYANPYHSWERGSNERGNRMMRKFIPKGTDISKVSENFIYNALCKINYQRRKIFNGESPMDMIKKLGDRISSIFEKFKFKNLLAL